MSDEAFQISGRVIERKSGRGIEGLLIEAWDKYRLLYDKPLDEDTTSHLGVFIMRLDKLEVERLLQNRRPQLYFRVIQNGFLIKNTQDSILWDEDIGEKEIVIKLDSSELVYPSAIAKEEPEVVVSEESGTEDKNNINIDSDKDSSSSDNHNIYPVADEGFQITGRTIERESGHGIEGLVIQAWEKSRHRRPKGYPYRNEPVGSDTTNNLAVFKLRLEFVLHSLKSVYEAGSFMKRYEF